MITASKVISKILWRNGNLKSQTKTSNLFFKTSQVWVDFFLKIFERKKIVSCSLNLANQKKRETSDIRYPHDWNRGANSNQSLQTCKFIQLVPEYNWWWNILKTKNCFITIWLIRYVSAKFTWMIKNRVYFWKSSFYVVY